MVVERRNRQEENASILLGLTALALGVGDVLVVTGASTGHDWRLFGCSEVVGEVVVEIETIFEDVGKEEKGRDEESKKRKSRKEEEKRAIFMWWCDVMDENSSDVRTRPNWRKPTKEQRERQPKK